MWGEVSAWAEGEGGGGVHTTLSVKKWILPVLGHECAPTCFVAFVFVLIGNIGVVCLYGTSSELHWSCCSDLEQMPLCCDSLASSIDLKK